MVLEWTPEEVILTFLCCSVSLHLKRSMGDSEPTDSFQHQSTGYLRTRGQEANLYETCACVIHTNATAAYALLFCMLYEILHD